MSLRASELQIVTFLIESFKKVKLVPDRKWKWLLEKYDKALKQFQASVDSSACSKASLTPAAADDDVFHEQSMLGV